MENNLERISTVKSEKLSAELYFQSLLEEAYSLHLLTDSDIERIQYECLELLAYKTERYNGMDSSSIRVEVAQNIMTSNLFTIGLWLKTFPNPDDAVTAIKDTKISELYEKGRKRIDTMVKTAKTIHAKILQDLVDTKNYFYSATVDGGIKGFFKLYYPDFGAQEIHITADYPVFNPMKKLVGIEFIQRYLQAIYYENAFCLNFKTEDIHHLLCGYGEEYGEMLFNIYEPILATAIGCVLAGENVHSLDMTENAISYLSGILKDKSSIEINTILLSAYDELKRIFPPKSNLQEQYMKTSIWAIASRVSSATEHQALDKVFIIPQYPETNPKIQFSFGDKMDNEQYRKIVEEIMQCRYLEDKIAIIKKQIHSLADLEDILLDAELSVEEITGVLHELGLPEIVALSKKYHLNSDLEMIELKEQELILYRCLHDFIASLSQEQQIWMSKAISMLDSDL